LHRDPFVVAVNKPPGLLVHRTALDAHEEHFALQSVRNAIGRRVWPAHRLDKGASGALLCALTREAASALGKAFEAGAVDKRYLALVRGWPPAEGVIDYPLARRLDDAEPRLATSGAREAQPATTQFTRLATIELAIAVDRFPTSRYALVLLAPRSGRRHQIRRHLKHIAHPVIGDTTYGKGRHNRFVAELVGTQRLWLHALSLGFAHPLTGEHLVIEAPLGEEWRPLARLAGWRWDTPWRIGDEAPALGTLPAVRDGPRGPLVG
jgi:tRNA pseudouridine65 synthase